MQGVFEKNIEQKLSSFSIEPSAQIWAEVEKMLHPPRKKRGLLWWWVPLAGILVLGVFTLYLNNRKTPETNTALAFSKEVIAKKELNFNYKKDSPIANNIKTVSNDIAVLKPDAFHSKKDIVIINKESAVITKQTITKNDEIKSTVLSGTSAKDEESAKQENVLNNTQKAITDSNKKTNQTAITDSAVKQKDTATTSVAKQITQQNNLKQQWYFNAEAGTLTINDLTLLPSFSNSNFLYASNPGNSNGSQIPTLYTTGSKTGFYFSAGIKYKKEISPNWNIDAGLQYHYFQNKQITGIRVDSTFGSSNYYFKAGSSNEMLNHAFAVELPFSVDYILNPKSKNKFYIQGGLSLDWLFANKWLITDTKQNVYYYQSSLINKFQLSASIGVGIRFANDMHFVIKIDQGISPFYQLNKENNYKQQISAQLLFPLHFLSKKKK